MLIFAAVILWIAGYPTYLYLQAAITGGITHRGDLTIVDLKAMSSFEMDQVSGTTSDVPPQFRAIDGKRVMLTGEMWAPNSAAGQLQGFDLVYSIGKCCFSGPPKVQHFVRSSVVGHNRVDYLSGQVNVIGTLRVGIVPGDIGVQSVYRLEVESIGPS
jgi:hypothetical protein